MDQWQRSTLFSKEIVKFMDYSSEQEPRVEVSGSFFSHTNLIGYIFSNQNLQNYRYFRQSVLTSGLISAKIENKSLYTDSNVSPWPSRACKQSDAIKVILLFARVSLGMF